MPLEVPGQFVVDLDRLPDCRQRLLCTPEFMQAHCLYFQRICELWAEAAFLGCQLPVDLDRLPDRRQRLLYTPEFVQALCFGI